MNEPITSFREQPSLETLSDKVTESNISHIKLVRLESPDVNEKKTLLNDDYQDSILVSKFNKGVIPVPQTNLSINELR